MESEAFLRHRHMLIAQTAYVSIPLAYLFPYVILSLIAGIHVSLLYENVSFIFDLLTIKNVLENMRKIASYKNHRLQQHPMENCN